MVLESRFDDSLGGNAPEDQQSCSKTDQTLVRLHLQWDWKGQLDSHTMGHSGGNIGGC